MTRNGSFGGFWGFWGFLEIWRIWADWAETAGLRVFKAFFGGGGLGKKRLKAQNLGFCTIWTKPLKFSKAHKALKVLLKAHFGSFDRP